MALEAAAVAHAGAFRLDVDLRVEPGTTTAVLGPSGSGKTLTLRAIAGLAAPSSGRIASNGRALFDSAAGVDLPPRLRRAGLVFQDYALFPHLTAEENIAYGARGPRAEARARVAGIVAQLGLGGLEGRRPSQLSGGQRQRVALGRALASEPEFLLLDEPFSALDAPTRAALTEQLLELETRLAVPAVLVTHDLAEAHALAQRIVVLDGGVILQAGAREEVFGRPASPRVGELVGVRNILPATVIGSGDGSAEIDASGVAMRVPDAGYVVGERVTAGVRARDVEAAPDAGGVARLVRVVDAGLRRTLVLAAPGGAVVYAELSAEADRRLGRDLPPAWRLSVAAGAGHVWRGRPEHE